MLVLNRDVKLNFSISDDWFILKPIKKLITEFQVDIAGTERYCIVTCTAVVCKW